VKNNIFEVGDLVRLKGFKQAKPEDVPYGMVISTRGRAFGDVEIKWLNKDVADRYILSTFTVATKLEILQKA
jgi:hypothetical protein